MTAQQPAGRSDPIRQRRQSRHYAPLVVRVPETIKLPLANDSAPDLLQLAHSPLLRRQDTGRVATRSMDASLRRILASLSLSLSAYHCWQSAIATTARQSAAHGWSTRTRRRPRAQRMPSTGLERQRIGIGLDWTTRGDAGAAASSHRSLLRQPGVASRRAGGLVRP